MNRKHGFATGKPRRLYRIWSYIGQRCNNPHSTHYKYYGGKGIKRCKDWDNCVTFYEWAMANGYNDSLTIDRIDGNGDYEPSNCRWVTRAENNRNKPTKRIGDWGIYPKKKGYYAQICENGINYYGGFSEDIDKVRLLRDELLSKIQNGLHLSGNETNLTDIDKRKRISRDYSSGRFVWN